MPNHVLLFVCVSFNFFSVIFGSDRYCRADKDKTWHDYRHAHEIPPEMDDYKEFKLTSKLEDITLRVEECPGLLARLVAECSRATKSTAAPTRPSASAPAATPPAGTVTGAVSSIKSTRPTRKLWLLLQTIGSVV